MKKTLIALLLAVALIVVPVSNALAANTDTVTVTATPGWISIVNAPNTYDFGVVLAGATPNTGVNYFTITNSSTVDMDVNIQCDGWASGGTTWTYGAAGVDQGQLNASSGEGGVAGSGGSGLYDVTIPNGVDALLCDAVGTATSPQWEMELEAPSSYTGVDVQSTTVTLTGVPD